MSAELAIFTHVPSAIFDPLLHMSKNMVAAAIVSTRLDYCNSLLAAVSNANTVKLQRAQNSLAHVVIGSRRRVHITPILADLHWLPVEYRIQFKIATLVFKTRSTGQPSYISSLF